MKPLSLYERATLFHTSFPNLPPFTYHNEKLYAFWLLGGGNVSSYYGSYHPNYLNRITSLFPDATKVVHLFSGSMPSGPYTRVGIDGTGQYKPDIVGNAENLASFLPFQPDLIYADPPYSVEDAEHYKNDGLVNRPRVVSECGDVLQPGGFLVWLDQVLPRFSDKQFDMVGLIGYIRSPSSRFRCITLLRRKVK